MTDPLEKSGQHNMASVLPCLPLLPLMSLEGISGEQHHSLVANITHNQGMT